GSPAPRARECERRRPRDRRRFHQPGRARRRCVRPAYRGLSPWRPRPRRCAQAGCPRARAYLLLGLGMALRLPGRSSIVRPIFKGPAHAPSAVLWANPRLVDKVAPRRRSMFISPAFAQDGAPIGGDPFTSILIPMALLVVIFYFLIFRPQQKRLKAQQQMLSAISRGDTGVTA